MYGPLRIHLICNLFSVSKRKLSESLRIRHHMRTLFHCLPHIQSLIYLISTNTKSLPSYSSLCKSSCPPLFYHFLTSTLTIINTLRGKKTTYTYMHTDGPFLSVYRVLKIGTVFPSHCAIHSLSLAINKSWGIIFCQYNSILLRLLLLRNKTVLIFSTLLNYTPKTFDIFWRFFKLFFFNGISLQS